MRIRFRRGDDRGSLPMALLLTLVGVSLAALLLPMVVTQVNATRFDTRRVNALNAAHAGLQAALGQIRDVPDRTECKPIINLLGLITVGGCSLIGVGLLGIGIDLVVFNKPNGLPCSPIQGSVGPGSTATYSTTIRYLPDDPRRHDDAWIQQNDWCRTRDSSVSAAYALVRSEGTDQGGTRTLEATYMFETPHRNSASGGLIDVSILNNAQCMAAPSNAPGPGALLRMANCAAGNARQTFSYNEDLTIRLDGSPNMCLTAGEAGSNVTFQPCASPPGPGQQWTLNDRGAFEGVTSGLRPTGLCFDLAGSLVVLSVGACGGVSLSWHAPPNGRPFRDIRER